MARSSARVAAVVTVAAGLAAGLAAAGPAATAAVSHPAGIYPAVIATPVNIIRDPGAEAARPNSSSGKVKVPAWSVGKHSQFTAVAYGASGGFPTSASPGPKKRGKNFFAGGRGNSSTGTQTDSLKAYRSLISSGRAKFRLSGWLGGFATQTDTARVTITWKSSGGKALGHTTIGPVTEGQRRGVTGMLLRSRSGAVPKGAVKVLITVRMVRKDGAYIDGYADNLGLTIHG
jgi:hypothetical protein